MLIFCLGTAAELIKCYPVIRGADRRGMPWVVLSTGQSPKNLRMQFDDFGLSADRYRVLLETREDLERAGQALSWFVRLLSTPRSRLMSALRGVPGFDSLSDSNQGSNRGSNRGSNQSIWVVHGDTLSTLAGARLGRRWGFPVAHIEAGMRSGTWHSPFPEEVSRRWVSGIASIHFPPNPEARSALEAEKRRGRIIATEGNTQLDALIAAIEDAPAGAGAADAGPYAIANLHRFENLNTAAHWRILIEASVQARKHCRLLFVMHPQTSAKLDSDPAAKKRLLDAGVELLPRQPFLPFARLLGSAEFLISDGGGNQDECKILGLPCLILRTHTESKSGLAPEGPCLLSELDESKVEEFFRDPARFRRAPYRPPNPPAARIVDAFAEALA